ncbi:MAG: hypothetical protein M0R06_03530 [Sphaerochaeta sp.]|jgi:hypothetical protein|nr:hypothetical protein [Sphaerochaeta sp.]
MARVTLKLKEAAFVLSFEEYGDCGPGDILRLVQAGKVSREQVYRAAESFGFRWDGKRWRRRFPQWLKNIERVCDGDD